MAPPKIFVSHSHKDDAFTDRLVEDLRQAGADAWMDKTDLGAGNFQQRIDEALANCGWFVLILTKDALDSPWVQEEVYAAKRLKNQSKIRDLIFIQAGPMDHRELPATWGVFNIFDATRDYDAARNRVLKALGLALLPPTQSTLAASLPPAQPTYMQLNELLFQQHNEYRRQEQAQLDSPPVSTERFPKRLADLGFTTHSDKGIEYILPPVCAVLEGPFLIGSDPKQDQSARENEQAQHTLTLARYEISRFPVTVAEYNCYVRDGGSKPLEWQTQRRHLYYPVVLVTWHDAVAYAAWLSELTGEAWRLPSDVEWEKAARGTDGRIYPWGNTFDKARCNTSESGTGTTTPVGKYPAGASPYAVQDMAGNACEWTSSRYLYRPNSVPGEVTEAIIPDNRVVRGGSWELDALYARTAALFPGHPDISYTTVGFRLVRAVPSS